MDQAMTIQDIEAQFDGEWVLVADPVTDSSLHVLQGRVVCHSKNRDEVYQQAIALKLPDTAILYNGKLPDNMAIVL
jgi:hypothetical protein